MLPRHRRTRRTRRRHRHRHRHRHRRIVLAAALALALVLAACGVSQKGNALSGESGIKGGMEDPGEQTSTSEPTEEDLLPPVELDVTGDDGNELNTVATTAVSDLETYWAEEFPQLYGGEYEPLSGGLFAYDSSTDPRSLPCPAESIDAMLGNAFYCPPDDAVAWDQETLLPGLAKEFGDFTVAVVLGHEWGHAIQNRAGNFDSSVFIELQADCFAGAWVAHVRESRPTHFLVDTAVLDQALGGVLFLKDSPGVLSDDPTAHGSGFDRVGAFQDGFQNGAEACVGYLDGHITPYQFPFTSEDDLANEGNLPLDGTEGIETAAASSIEAYWTATFPELSGGAEWEPLAEPVRFAEGDPPSCNGTTVDTFRLFLCLPERYVGYSARLAEDAYARYGDFGFATLLGSQYGLAVQDALGDMPDDEVVMTLRGDCYAGSWAGALLPDEDGLGDEDLQLVLSPGDLDEAVGVLLGIRSESDRIRQGPGFDRVAAFRQGVIDGAASCAAITAE
ncbi:MAG: neutral zinc metallopeptidase [Actinobacteria bacterium]|nr:neutral zinc metallopeptidase [Actinomycetota bacterium]